MKRVTNDAYCLDVNGHCALLTSGRLLLVDTGTESDAKTLLSEIKLCGYKPSDISHIVITHVHPDHVGGLAKMKELSDAEIASHELEAKFIAKEEIYNGPPGKEYQTHPGTLVDVKLHDGDVYQGLLVIHTPGHTPGHISLLDKENLLLLAGDSLRTEDKSIQPMPDMYNIDPHQHRLSLKKLSDFEFDKVIAGHGDPIEKNAKLKLIELIRSIKL